MNLVFHEEMVRLLRAGRPVAVATVVGRQGSTPRDFGAKMIVTEEGKTVFSIGGGAFEALVIEDAREAIRERRGIEKEYRFTEQGANALGMVCGGSARVLIEVVRPPDVGELRPLLVQPLVHPPACDGVAERAAGDLESGNHLARPAAGLAKRGKREHADDHRRERPERPNQPTSDKHHDRRHNTDPRWPEQSLDGS